MRHPDTVYSADSIEFKPATTFSSTAAHNDASDASARVFVCGTYQVDKLSSGREACGDEGGSPDIRRKGRAIMYQVNEEMDGFSEIQRFDTPAILDMKWSPPGAPGPSRLAIANAGGQVTLHRWQDVSKTTAPLEMGTGAGIEEAREVKCGAAGRLEPVEAIQVTEEKGVLVLSLDWSSQLEPSLSDSLITSLSSGHLAHLTPDSTGSLRPTSKWHAHDHEPWITAWDKWAARGNGVVWSGGDDLKLKRWDVREQAGEGDGEAGIVVEKCFEGGVTTIASSPHVEHLLAVGSYDENLRLFDTRFPLRPLRTLPVGGGVWRTKWHPDVARKDELLLACMHGGAKVVRVDTSLSRGDEEDGCAIVAHFLDGHGDGAIAYGADWSGLRPRRRHSGGGGREDVDGDDSTGKGEEQQQSSVVATCSFYDHTVHLWDA